MAYTPFTISNIGVIPAEINSIVFADDASIQHHANLTVFGGDYSSESDYTGNTTVKSRAKTYVTGSPLRSNYLSHTKPQNVQYQSNVGTTLVVDSTAGIAALWEASGNQYDGTYVVSVTSATWLVMSAPPSGTPTVGGTITFTTTTNLLEISSTTGIGPGWTVSSNGYSASTLVISVVDSNFLVVSALPDTDPQPNNPIIFTSSTNFLTLNNTSQLDIGWIASGNGYNGSQAVTSVVDGSTVIMSGPPTGVPSSGGTITFISTTPLYTLGAGASVTFTIDYTNNVNTFNTYTSVVSINATQGAPVIKYINNFVAINAVPVVIESPIYTDRGGNGGGASDGRDFGFTPDPNPGTVGGWGYGNGTGIGVDAGKDPSGTVSA